MSFGGTDWKISPLDINVGTVTSGMCAGAIFDAGVLAGGGFNETWIVGDTFLKNVYSVFRAEPPAVGFAQLASGLSSSTGTFDPNPLQSGSLPAPTTSGGSSGGGLIGAASANENIAVSLTLLATVTACFALLL
jgi:cathepsin D